MSKIGGSIIRSTGRRLRRAVTITLAWPASRALSALRDTRAVTSLEFALMAVPFFGLMVATMSVGVWYFYNACLDVGIYKAGRLVMTGQFQAKNISTPANFSTSILCPNMPGFIPCSTSNPQITMAVVNNISSLFNTRTATVPGSNPPVTYQIVTLKDPLPQAICSPQQGSLVYVQAKYTMPSFMSIFTLFTGTTPGHTARTMFNNVVTAGTTVKVEEFPTGSATFTNCAGEAGSANAPCCPS